MKLEIIIDGKSYQVEAPPTDRSTTQRKLVIDGGTHQTDIVRVEPGTADSAGGANQ